MELAINEVKTQAKKLLKALKVDGDLEGKMQLPLKKLAITSIDELKLKHCLSLVSMELGFTNWHQFKDVLSGNIEPLAVNNMGSFFYPKSGASFINEWFADYQVAKSTVEKSSQEKWLLPYKNQFIVVTQDYINALNLESKLTPLWTELEHNMVTGYNRLAWDTLACAVIKSRIRTY